MHLNIHYLCDDVQTERSVGWLVGRPEPAGVHFHKSRPVNIPARRWRRQLKLKHMHNSLQPTCVEKCADMAPLPLPPPMEHDALHSCRFSANKSPCARAISRDVSGVLRMKCCAFTPLHCDSHRHLFEESVSSFRNYTNRILECFIVCLRWD